ncbi:MAG TPA: alpha/beta hydrolase family protein [bacterium]|nr:alpha/beta hydrolase family protein [bacterium]
MYSKNCQEKLSPSNFHLALMKQAPKTLAFSKDENFTSWRKKLKKKLEFLIGPMYRDKGKVEIKILKKDETDRYSISKILFPTNSQSVNVAYLLVPKTGKSIYPAMVCLQGHSEGAFISTGNHFGEGGKNFRIEGDRDFAVQAAENGFVALAIEQRCFGEREEKLLKQKINNRCWDASMHALMLGHTLLAERISDVSRGIDMLEQLPYVDTSRIGCMGNSGGGTTTYYASCLDDRIKIAIPSCSFCTYEDSLMRIGHCMDNYIPGSLKYFGMEDLAGLIAPRKLIVVAGRKDDIFPIKGVRKAYRKALDIYRHAGSPSNIKLVEGPEGHRFYAGLSWPVINQAAAKPGLRTGNEK